MPDFTDKVCLVTGAASGIGRATAIKMASHGATLALSDINEQGVQQTRKLCQDANKSDAHVAGILDVGSTKDVNAYVKTVAEQYGGKVDFVFNCAGVSGMDQCCHDRLLGRVGHIDLVLTRMGLWG